MENNKLIESLVKAQLEIEAPGKDKSVDSGKYKFKYSSLDAIYAACRRPLANQGLTLSHTVRDRVLVTSIHHVSGEVLSNEVPLFIENTTSQGFGSALTYARRYAICSILGLPTEDDEDGQRATDEQKQPDVDVMNSDQVREIVNASKGREKVLTSIMAHHKKSEIGKLPAKEFEFIMKNLRAS